MPRQQLRNFGQALDFLPSPAGDITPATRQVFSGEFTIACWFNWRTGSTTAFFFGDTTTDIKIGFNAGIWFIRVLSGGAGVAPTPVPAKGVWNLVVITRNAANKVDFYLNDGSPQRLYSDAAQAGNFNLGYIGRTNVGQNWSGKLDEIMSWNRALTSEEVSNLYRNVRTPTNGLTLRYLLDEGSGPTATDSSGNGNNGAITNATYTTDVPMKTRPTVTNRLTVRDFGTALHFPNTTNYVQTPSHNLNLGNNMTFSAWVRPLDIVTNSGNRDTIWGSSNASGQFQLEISGGNEAGRNRIVVIVPGSYVAETINDILKPREWQHIVYTRNGTGDTHAFYVNGVSVSRGVSQSPTLDFTDGASVKLIGARTTTGQFLGGTLDELRLWNRTLSAQEVAQLYAGAFSRQNLVAEYLFDEGAGPTANDTSGNTNHGTITGAIFSADMPMKARQEVNANLVKNGNFEYAPPFIAATSTANRFIDGTAGGSTVNKIFGWAVASLTGTGSIRFDSSVAYSGNSSLKLSLEAVASRIHAGTTSTLGTPPISDLIPVLPNVSYTVTCWVKTNVISGDSTGAFIRLGQYTGAPASVRTDDSSAIKVTSDWSLLTLTVTMQPTTSYLNVQPIIVGNLGASTLIMDAWFDDIVLKPTTAVTRVTA